MVDKYEDLPPGEAVKEYSLNILNKCMSSHFSEAEVDFVNLEYMLKAEGAKKELINRLIDLKKILPKLQGYCPGCAEFIKYFKPLEHDLANISEEFSERYRKIA